MLLLIATLREGGRAGLLGWAAATGITALATGIALLWGAAPAPGTWVALVGLGAVTVQALAIPVGLGALVSEGLRRIAVQGALLGLCSVGRGGRAWIPGALALGGAAGLLTLCVTVWAGPAAERAVVTAVEEGVERSALRVGQPLVAEGWVVGLEPDGGVFLGGEGVVGAARSAAVVRGAEGVALVLGPGCAEGPEGTVCWERWEHPLAPRGRRRELRERGLLELAQVAARTEAAGGDAAYEWAVLYKRLLHPLSVALLPLALVPGALSPRSWARLGLVGLGWLVAVRLGDHLALSWGAWTAWAGTWWIAGWAAVGWARWRGR
ncbi:MAG: hypothetical protein JXX28_18850 [Deltaproteobacteria bacterium]|nr:hypothetical protein [Deltaproteobacteria bacterium]